MRTTSNGISTVSASRDCRRNPCEIGIPADDIMVEEGNTDTAPYGLGTYGSRSTPVAGAAIATAARKIKAKAQMIAAYKLEVHEDDLEWDIDGFRVKGLPEKSMSDRNSRRRYHGRGRQYRYRALRARYIRLALDAGRGRRDRHGGAQDQGQGADDRRLQARGA